MLRNFGGSIVFALVGLGLAGWYGWSETHSTQAMLQALWIVLVLSVLEVSLSFDNAVVNATVLKDMDPVWQRRFLTWGMAIAVFGMRVAFPLAIVAVAAGIGPLDAVRLSLRNPADYERIVSSAHVSIAGFGGAFLCLVGSKFFFDREKKLHWITAVEAQLARFSHIPSVEIALLLGTMFAISMLLPQVEALAFLGAGMMGIVVFVAVEGVSRYLELRDEAARARAFRATRFPTRSGWRCCRRSCCLPGRSPAAAPLRSGAMSGATGRAAWSAAPVPSLPTGWRSGR